MENLLNRYGMIPKIKEFLQNVGSENGKSQKENIFPALVTGVDDRQKEFLFLTGSLVSGAPSLYVAEDFKRAKEVYENVRKSKPEKEVLLFPAIENFSYHVDALSHEILWKRNEVIQKLLLGRDIMVVAPTEAFLTKLPLKSVYEGKTLTIRVGQEVSFEALVERLTKLGYTKEILVESKGQFSVRGGIIDLWISDQTYPTRLEFFGDEVDSIRSFEPDTQRSLEKWETVTVISAVEYILEEESFLEGIERIKKDILSLKEKSRETEEIAALEERIEKLRFSREPESIGGFFSYFYKEGASLLDYFPKDSLVFLEEKEKLLATYSQYEEEYKDQFLYLLEKQAALKKQYDNMMDKIEWEKRLEEHREVQLTLFVADSEKQSGYASVYPIYSRELILPKGKLSALIETVKKLKKEKYTVLIYVRNEEQGKKLQEYFFDQDLIVSFVPMIGGSLKKEQVVITVGNEQSAVEFPEDKIAFLSTKVFFDRRKEKKSRFKKTAGDTFLNYRDLKVGDYVVHVNHGIGRYHGVEQLEIDHVYKDFLFLEYAGGDKLYVPVDQMGLVQKYVSEEGHVPRIHRLGSSEWAKSQARVKASLKELAMNLLELYAEREMVKGFAFSPDTEWQRQMEDSFPFDETPDQLKAIEEIKEDMEQPKPMDRLLCGDVGYGKTEVALRAAFKAVMDGKQVAILTPTTILAQQHYNTILERFQAFPVKVGLLSRFRTKKEQETVLNGLKDGSYDVVVGTHKILQKKVQFHDLGLLIVDEEQRFGVGHKETIKDLKRNVDVLTLSATPIPRTLNMSLSGIKDMSNIETAPENRYPVNTYVMEYDSRFIKNAIMREVNRGGQVYFVYNSVKDMTEMARNLGELLPGVKIAVAHGQMREERLEDVMVKFLNKEYDMLLTTTIIETGMDIPNVNTLVVYDADRFGLSQLHQLRGRVGRTNRQAYAYLTYRKNKNLSEVAEKRLKAIKDFAEFGAGIQIAMRDLEIRGSGNLLGPEQHGHIVTVGYDLYYKMLKETIQELRGEEEKVPFTTTVEIKVDKYIPKAYISMESDRIRFYKLLGSAQTIEELYDIEEEMEDRFGDIPSPVRNILELTWIKIKAESLRIESVTEQKNGVVFTFETGYVFPDGALKELSDLFSKRERLSMSVKDGKLSLVLGSHHNSTKGTEKLQMIKKLILSLENVLKTDETKQGQ